MSTGSNTDLWSVRGSLCLLCPSSNPRLCQFSSQASCSSCCCCLSPPVPYFCFLCSDSTRSLYEKKLREAMAQGKGAKYSKPSPDKTYYREEGICPLCSPETPFTYKYTHILRTRLHMYRNDPYKTIVFEHFIRNICTAVYSCSDPISQ